MRTSGTFQDVYNAARAYEIDEAEGCPMNPVIRREGGTWMLESGMEPTDGDFEVTLEAFDQWFWESYKDSGFYPSETDIEEFIRAHSDAN